MRTFIKEKIGDYRYYANSIFSRTKFDDIICLKATLDNVEYVVKISLVADIFKGEP